MINLTCPITDISPLVPHSGEMVLLDRIIDFGSDYLIAEAKIKSDNILIKGNRLPSFLGAEIMAQGVAAWEGCRSVRAGKPINLGYWIGSRKLNLNKPYIEIGSQLEIAIKLSTEDESTGFGIFDCKLIDKQSREVLIEGAINVFSPPA